MVTIRTVKVWHKTDDSFDFLCSMTALLDPDNDANVILDDDNLDTIIDVLISYKERHATDNGTVVTRPPSPRIPDNIDDRRYAQIAAIPTEMDD